MRFCWSTIAVKDMEESLAFYTNILGLTLNQRRPAGPGMELAFLGEGETEIELLCDHTKTKFEKIDGISLGFEMEAPEKTMELLKQKGIEIESGPFSPNPHVSFFFVRDPNGVRIQLVEKR